MWLGYSLSVRLSRRNGWQRESMRLPEPTNGAALLDEMVTVHSRCVVPPDGHAEPGRCLDRNAEALAGVKLRNTIVGDVWLVADDATLAEHPDIIRAELPVFFFDELERLRGKIAAELRAIGMVKATFPTSRVLQ